MTTEHFTRELPNIAERYSTAVSTSDLTVHEHRTGPAHLLVAAGISARQSGGPVVIDQPTIALGHALARLQAEWHALQKPVQRRPRSVRQWIELLPLVKTGERIVDGAVIPIMGRDREGSKRRHLEEMQQLEALYEMELRHLAQRLPSRYAVRERLFVVAVYWGLEDPDRVVAEALRFWLDPNCPTCHGTGETLSGEKVMTCQACEGRRAAPVPGEVAGRRLLKLMSEAKHAWVQSVQATSRRMRRRVDAVGC